MATAGVILSQKEGDVKEVVQETGGTLCVPHMDDDTIRAYFGRHCKAESTEVMENIAGERVSAKVRSGSNLESELEYWNHRCAAKYGGVC